MATCLFGKQTIGSVRSEKQSIQGAKCMVYPSWWAFRRCWRKSKISFRPAQLLHEDMSILSTWQERLCWLHTDAPVLARISVRFGRLWQLHHHYVIYFLLHVLKRGLYMGSYLISKRHAHYCCNLAGRCLRQSVWPPSWWVRYLADYDIFLTLKVWTCTKNHYLLTCQERLRYTSDRS